MPTRASPRETKRGLARLLVRDPARTMVPMAFLKSLAIHLRQNGLEPVDVMPELAQALASEGLSRYPAEPYCQMLFRAATLLDDPLFGLHLGQTLNPSDLGALGYALMSCANLGEALVRAQRYHRLINDVTPMTHAIVGDTLELRWGVQHGRMGALYDESGITIFIEFGRRLSGLHLAPRAVAFVNPPPDDPSPYISYFGCPVTWEQPDTCLTISLQSLQLPLVRPDSTLLNLMEKQADDALSTLAVPNEDVATAVRRSVMQLSNNGIPQISLIAADMKMPTRSLYRLLAAQGLNYRTLRDQALEDKSKELLTTTPLNLVEITQRLGYSELSAFIRAFRRWTGSTPDEWRRQATVNDEK